MIEIASLMLIVAAASLIGIFVGVLMGSSPWPKKGYFVVNLGDRDVEVVFRVDGVEKHRHLLRPGHKVWSEPDA